MIFQGQFVSTFKKFSRLGCILAAILLFITEQGHAQQAPNGNFPFDQGPQQGANQPNVFQGPAGLVNNGSQGGAASADFDSLIDVIQSTVAFDSWADNGTGEGNIMPFPNGVYVDAAGTLKFSPKQISQVSLEQIPATAKTKSDRNDVRQTSSLRYISLPRLEAAIDNALQQGQPLSVEMLTLAGLQRIEYVIAYPESADLVIAGPAGDWQILPDGKILSSDTGQPVVRLDDLLTLWRRQLARGAAGFGCSITPRQQALAKTQQFVQASSSKAIEPRQRKTWLKQLRDCLGKQDVEFFGIAANSHAARTLLHADYHMKLIGMGIVEGVEGVESYLDTVRLLPNGQAPPMAILRWWFAMNYSPVKVSPDRTVFQLNGPGVQVLSENELLAARGQRIHTGQSDELNQRFASSFTTHFEQICERYPVYGELRNIFDLSFALTLAQQERLFERVGWQPSLFSNEEQLLLPTVRVPREVDTVLNHRVIRGKHIIAGISGGVWMDATKAIQVNTASRRQLPQMSNTKPQENLQRWWWD